MSFFYEQDEVIHDYTQTMNQLTQREANRKWVELRDKIALDMWIDY